MNWADSLINKIIGLPYKDGAVTKQHITFKGSGEMSPYREYWWNKGFKDGFDFAVKYTVNGFCTKEWPKGWGGELYNGHYGDGYAEGQLSGRSFCIDRDFPNWCSVSIDQNILTVVFKSGEVLKVNRPNNNK